MHPYAETAPAGPQVHDLTRRLTGDDEPWAVLAPGVVDALAPVGSFAAGGEVVALARRAAGAGDGSVWVAGDHDRERSFAALAALAAASEDGSGWLEWEPFEGAGPIRDEPVVHLAPHRHFPAGPDEPWVSAAIGGGRILAVPLRFAVSYRPDPGVRRRWNEAFENLLL